jgi:hypothetical protein
MGCADGLLWSFPGEIRDVLLGKGLKIFRRFLMRINIKKFCCFLRSARSGAMIITESEF